MKSHFPIILKSSNSFFLPWLSSETNRKTRKQVDCSSGTFFLHSVGLFLSVHVYVHVCVYVYMWPCLHVHMCESVPACMRRNPSASTLHAIHLGFLRQHLSLGWNSATMLRPVNPRDHLSVTFLFPRAPPLLALSFLTCVLWDYTQVCMVAEQVLYWLSHL